MTRRAVRARDGAVPRRGAAGRARGRRATAPSSSVTSTHRRRPSTRYADVARRRASTAGLHVHEVTRRGAGGDVRHAGAAGAARGLPAAGRRPRRRAATGRPALLVVLTNVRDPGNAGTVIRGADAAGADAVAGQRRQRRRLQPQGRAVHRRLAVPPAGRRPACPSRRLLGRAARARAAAAGRRRRRARTCCTTSDLAPPHAWVMGNEAWGLHRRCATPATRSCGCRSTAAPSRLNLAMAATVCLYTSAGPRSRRGGVQWIESRSMAVDEEHAEGAHVPSGGTSTSTT